MWNLKYGTNELIYKTETDSQTERTDLWLPRESWGGRGMDWEFGVGRRKLLHLEWIHNKVLLYSTGNYIQYSVTNHNGKECEKEYIIYIYVYNLSHFAVQQKLTQHCKSTILQ